RELEHARGLVDAAAHHELFDGGLPRARPRRVERRIDLHDATPLLRGELRRVFEKNDAVWVMECYPTRDAESKLDFKARIAFFLEWALLRLETARVVPVRACVVIDGEHDDGWQHRFDAWQQRFETESAKRAAMLEDLERRVGGLVDFWRRAQRQPQWYFPA